LSSQTGSRLKFDAEEKKRIVSAIREALNGEILTREQLANEVVERLGMSASVRKHMLSGWGNLLQPAAEQGTSALAGARDLKSHSFDRTNGSVDGTSLRDLRHGRRFFDDSFLHTARRPIMTSVTGGAYVLIRRRC